MKRLVFHNSEDYTLGVELEYQIINPATYNLTSKAKELIRNVSNTSFQKFIKPEITQSMLEINTSIHTSPKTIIPELQKIRQYLLEQAEQLNVLFCGGGTHPFQKWITKKIFPTKRYHKLAKRYQYLSKRSTVYGLHVHIGCSSPERALYLTHIFHRYVPQLIAMSASSPFYQGVDTGYHSSRTTIFNMFPSSGTIPYLTSWKEFSNYFFKMENLGVIESMKDFYWDIRPKPEFGTVEIRVCDMPLTFEKVIAIVAYIQTLSCHILQTKSLPLSKEIYLLHNFNRFQAARYGLDGEIIDPFTDKKIKIREDILKTIADIKASAKYLDNTKYIKSLMKNVQNKKNDATVLRATLNKTGSLKEVVREQCRLWMK